MAALNHFRTFEISQDGKGNAFELDRSDERVVCLAFDARFGCLCEIAALTQTAGAGSTPMDTFLEQASTAAGLHHRGLATLLDYGDDQGVRFYATEFIDGEPLSGYARRVNGLPPSLAFGICRELAEALGAISVLGLPIAAGKARVTLDDRGRLRVRIVDYPLGLVNPDGPRDAVAGLFEVAHLLEELASGAVIGDQGKRVTDVREVAERLRALGSIHDAVAVLHEAGGGGFVAVEARHRPKLLLAGKLYAHGSAEDFLSDDYRVEQVSAAAADPYSISVVRQSESRPLRMHVLPPEYILSDEGLPIYETERSPAVVGAEALWRSDHFRLVSEDRSPGFSLTALLRQAGELSDLEVMAILDRIETAILEARSAGAELVKVHPDNVLFHFAGWGFAEAEALISQRPVTSWPDYSITLRAFQTMRGLTTLTPNAKQRFVQMRAQIDRGDAVCNLAVLELYLQLHDSGRSEQAEELLDRFEQSCRAAMAASQALADPVAREAADGDFVEAPGGDEAEREEILSPIALGVAGELEVGEWDDDEEGLSPLGGGILFGREIFQDDAGDGGTGGGLAGYGGGLGADDDEDGQVFLSPIAAAMGVSLSEEDQIDEAVDEEGDGGDDYWPEHGEEVAGEQVVSPFAWDPQEGDDDGGLPELDLESGRNDFWRGVVIFIVLTAVLSGVGALVVHFFVR